MNENTHIAVAMDVIGDSNAQYDKSVKELLADKQILSRILKYTLREFEAMEPDEIAARIEGEPKVGTVPVDPGLTNTAKVSGGNTEDSVQGEGFIFFDVLTEAAYGDLLSTVIIDLEAQKDARPSKLGYHVENRAQFYAARMISSEKMTKFFKSDYDSIRPVKSIWICMNCDKPSIVRYTMKPEKVYGNPSDGEDAYEPISLMEYVIVSIRGDGSGEESKNELISLLEDLLGADDSATKKNKLSTRHGIKMKVETEGRINKMCDLSMMVEERGVKQGIGISTKVIRRHIQGVANSDIASEMQIDEASVDKIIDEFEKS
ncbi:MAG: hypothetical protein LUI02_02495 [Clostridiales bacterium]|nr:hypothetical protein [Clostridiales bacterium]